VSSGNLKNDIIEYLKSFTLLDTDYLLLNTIKNRDLIPYAHFPNTILYDPPYVASQREIFSLLSSIRTLIGPKDNVSDYTSAVNSLRASIIRTKENLPQSVYFNALTLLSDCNQSNLDSLDAYLSRYTSPYIVSPVKKKAIFLGDPVSPKYFDTLNAAGIWVSAFAPYEFFMTPCDRLDSYYFENPIFQSQLYTLVETRRLISEHQADILILNPGGIYLSETEADFLAYKFSKDVTVYKLPGVFTGAPIQI
jgi:hypothetical protein